MLEVAIGVWVLVGYQRCWRWGCLACIGIVRYLGADVRRLISWRKLMVRNKGIAWAIRGPLWWVSGMWPSPGLVVRFHAVGFL